MVMECRAVDGADCGERQAALADAATCSMIAATSYSYIPGRMGLGGGYMHVGSDIAGLFNLGYFFGLLVIAHIDYGTDEFGRRAFPLPA